MREITEKHIIEMIRNNEKWKGSGRIIKGEWKGAKRGTVNIGKAYKGVNK